MKINGYKTYIVAVGMIMWAVGGALCGKVELNIAIQTVFTALALMGLKHAI